MALKKCPFCGGTPNLKDFGDGEGGWMISCICGCIMTAYAEHPEMENWPTIHEQIRENVIRNWERRYPIREGYQDGNKDGDGRSSISHD